MFFLTMYVCVWADIFICIIIWENIVVRTVLNMIYVYIFYVCELMSICLLFNKLSLCYYKWHQNVLKQRAVCWLWVDLITGTVYSCWNILLNLLSMGLTDLIHRIWPSKVQAHLKSKLNVHETSSSVPCKLFCKNWPL